MRRHRVLVCGSRDWTNGPLIAEVLRRYSPSTVIHGDCRGADRIAGAIARDMGIEVLSVPAEWGRYGRAAGPMRNQRMLEVGRPDRVLAFHNSLQSSRGTGDMVERARRANIPVEVVSERLRR